MADDAPPRRRTELDDLERPVDPPVAWFAFARDARLFARRAVDARRLEEGRATVELLPNEIHRPPVPADVAVRLGRIRVSEFLPDGREITRAVLQAGALFRTRPWPGPPRPAAPGFDLAYVVLMALDEAELWVLPPGALDGADAPAP
ncbi:MAG: hypothetical protein ACYDIE_06225 [Candidatus Krumholzibacteriia bacterium]